MRYQKASSKAQYKFYEDQLKRCDPNDHLRRAALVEALKGVDYESLPDRKGSVTPQARPTPPPQPPAPTPKLRLPPSGYATPLELYRYNSIDLDAGLRHALTNCGYITYVSGVGHVAVTKDLTQKGRLQAQWRTMTVLTLREVRSYFEDPSEPITTLRQAAEILASPAAPEAVPQPQPKAQAEAGCPFCGCPSSSNDNNEAFN